MLVLPLLELEDSELLAGLVPPPASDPPELDVVSDAEVAGFVAAGPLADDVEARESVMYQPLPLKTMPTGWMTLRSAPPHCSHVVSGGSVKLWRFSMMSLQAVQV